jgi:hypothetical protein
MAEFNPVTDEKEAEEAWSMEYGLQPVRIGIKKMGFTP